MKMGNIRSVYLPVSSLRLHVTNLTGAAELDFSLFYTENYREWKATKPQKDG
jgi:hypothetical protein